MTRQEAVTTLRHAAHHLRQTAPTKTCIGLRNDSWPVLAEYGDFWAARLLDALEHWARYPRSRAARTTVEFILDWPLQR